ncbi:MAG TPA: hypothetical protein VNG13_07490 [Mycobacteriales bacterium]|nr:hypothetical protein [Mycobacteriales bacterium]
MIGRRGLRWLALAGVMPIALATGGPAVSATAPSHGAAFLAGAAVTDFTPPLAGQIDPADCAAGTALASVYSGPRQFAFEEPYVDQSHVGHYVLGDPYLDCNHNGRWDGDLLGGGGSTPRFYDHVADPVTARALVVSNGRQEIAVEVVDQEGLFNVYQARIRAEVAADGYHLDGIFISATHDESAPDSLGLGGVNSATSGTNDYFVDYLVHQSALAIEHAAAHLVPAHLKFAEALEPADLRQCWSSYPFVDDQLMPTVQAVANSGSVIATLADVSQHAETLGFNPNPVQADWVSADWPHFFRAELQARFGGVGIEMAGSVGSNETPAVFSGPISRVPQKYFSADHPAGCRTLFAANGAMVPLGYQEETATLGRQLADAVAGAIADSGTWSATNRIWGARTTICVPLANFLFSAAAAAGVFAERPGYTPGCAAQVPTLPNGSSAGTSVLSEVAAFRIGDGEFVSIPGEVFPFTFLRSFLQAPDMSYPQFPLPPWLIPHMHTPYRFVDGLAEDMIGYIFPRGNGVGVPGEYPVTNPQASGTDRFDCGHSDDSESASSQAGDIIGAALVSVLDAEGGPAEDIQPGRYVLPDGLISPDPLGTPGSVKCSLDTLFHPDGPAVAVWLPGGVIVRPAAWLSLSGRPQLRADRNTRGWIGAAGTHHWLDVFGALRSPTRVSLAGAAGPGKVRGGAGTLALTGSTGRLGLAGLVLLSIGLALGLRGRRQN